MHALLRQNEAIGTVSSVSNYALQWLNKAIGPVTSARRGHVCTATADTMYAPLRLSDFCKAICMRSNGRKLLPCVDMYAPQ